MKQYTTPEQTAKLIELGVEKPKSIEAYRDGHCVPFVEQRWVYSIGELIEMLPSHIGLGKPLMIKRSEGDLWWVGYKNVPTDKDDDRIYSIWSADYEFVDALYDMLIDLLENDLIHLKSNGNTKDK